MQTTKVAVDLDEVLGSFLTRLTKFYNSHYGGQIQMTDYRQSVPYCETWGISHEACTQIVLAFCDTKEFQTLEPVHGAREALGRLKASGKFEFYVVTARGIQLKEETQRWLQEHFTIDGEFLFTEVCFGNCLGNQKGTMKPKHVICKERECTILIDDSTQHADVCANNGIHVILFNLDKAYEWCNQFTKTEPHHHTSITEKMSWKEIEDFLMQL